jgi:hypothetical protein
MPEAADAIADGLYESNDYLDGMADLYIVDNGSDLKPPAESTTVLLPENGQTTAGFLAGIAAAKKSGIDYLAYCFMITSTKWSGLIGISHALHTFENEPSVVGYSPALTPESTTAWDHMKIRNTAVNEEIGLPFQRPTWMIDNICAFWRKDWFDSIGGFDPKLTYAWGIDLETSYLARKQGKTILIDDYWYVHKTTDIAYDMDRMNMTAKQRRINAREEMARVLSSRYGKNWELMIRQDYVTEAMK